MKRFFTLALCCLCLVGVYGQMPLDTEQNIRAANGIYLFQKAELSIRNSETKEIIEHKIIEDTASIDPYDLHLENTFLKLELRDGYLTKCVLADRQKYTIDDMMQMHPAKDDKKDVNVRALPEMEGESIFMYENRSLRPYDLRSEGDKLIVSTSKYPFGHSDYKFTMEAELIITLTKQKDDETDNI